MIDHLFVHQDLELADSPRILQELELRVMQIQQTVSQINLNKTASKEAVPKKLAS